MSNEPTPPPKKDAAIAKNTLRALRAARDGSGAASERDGDESAAVEPDLVEAESREPKVVEPDAAEPDVGETEPVESESVESEPVESEPAGSEPDETETDGPDPVVLKKTTRKTKIDLPPTKPGGTSARGAKVDPTRTKAAARPRRRASRGVVVSAVVAVLALAFAVIAGVVWWQAGHDDDRGLADTRDTVALQSRLDIEAVNTSDYRQPAASLTKWLSVSTGSLHDQFAQSRADAVSLLAKAKIVTTATVLDAAVTALNPGKGTATVIASVNVLKKPATGAAATTRNRFQGSMTRVDGQWKLSNLMLVSVQLT